MVKNISVMQVDDGYEVKFSADGADTSTIKVSKDDKNISAIAIYNALNFHEGDQVELEEYEGQDKPGIALHGFFLEIVNGLKDISGYIDQAYPQLANNAEFGADDDLGDGDCAS